MIVLPIRDGDWEMPIQFETVLRDHYYDVPEEMTKAKVWLLANPHRKPTIKGVRRFCVNWLNRGKKLRPVTAPVSSKSVYLTEPVQIDVDTSRKHLEAIKARIRRVA